MLRRTRRAPTACSWCHRRKVRCDASIFGSPCTRCRQDGRRECVLRVKNPKPASSSTDPIPLTNRNSDSNDLTRDRHHLGQSNSHSQIVSQFHLKCDSLYNLSESPRTHHPNVLYTQYAFIDSQQLQALPLEDLTFLFSKDCLSLPGSDSLDEFVREYFKRIHPLVPVLDEAEFWRDYRDDQASGGKISLLVLQSLLFASCPLVSLEALRQCGFDGRRDARKQLYNKAKLLFELRTETRSHANAQAAVLLSHHTSADDPQAGSMWVKKAIEHAMLIDAESSLQMESVTISHRKRLWWSILLRDRSLCIGLRRRPQIVSISADGCSEWLSTEDFSKELHKSRVYNYDTKKRLLEALQRQCELAVLLTDLVSLIFTSRKTSRRYLSMTEFQSVLSRIKNIKKSLDDWQKASQPLVSPSKTSLSEGADTIATLTYLTYMFYFAAQVDLAQYAAFFLEENLFYAGDTYSDLVLEIGDNLRDGIDGLSLVMEHFSINGNVDGLPLSVLGYISMPLVLAAIDLKLSPSREETEIRQGRLNSLSRIIRHSEALYDVTDFVAIGTNHILHLAYETTQNLFLVKGKSQFLSETITGDISLSWTPSQTNLSTKSMSIEPSRPTNWQDAFIRCPRAYLLISTCVDHSLAFGNLPAASVLPAIVRDLAGMGAIAQLPWTSNVSSFEYGNGLTNQEQQQSQSVGNLSNLVEEMDCVEAIRTNLELEPSLTRQTIHTNGNLSPDMLSDHYTMPPVRIYNRLQHFNGVADQIACENTGLNLDFMDLEEYQTASNVETEACTFTIPLEQPIFDAYDASATLPSSIKTTDSTLFDSFFHEAFEQNWAVS